MGKVLIPKTYVEHIDEPLIFLAGPITCAPLWQDEAINLLFSQHDDLAIASPRFGVREAIKDYVVTGENDHFPRARAWERHYLEIAARTGAILFWFAGREDHDSQKVYGAMTRTELGQWMTRYSLDNTVRFCVGTDGNFPEFGPLKYDLSVDAPDKVIHSTLVETCNEALRLAYQ